MQQISNAVDGVLYQDENGRFADFHSLRHTTGSMLAASGVNPKVAQSLMRHSTVELTLGRYSHIYKGQETDAIASLPDLTAPSQQRLEARATGTDDLPVLTIDTAQKSLAKSLAKTCEKTTISANVDEQIAENQNYSKTAFPSEKPHFPSENKTGQDGNRTRTPLRAGDFKSPASANSATRPTLSDKHL